MVMLVRPGLPKTNTMSIISTILASRFRFRNGAESWARLTTGITLRKGEAADRKDWPSLSRYNHDQDSWAFMARNILITGASSGLGRALAIECGASGMTMGLL